MQIAITGASGFLGGNLMLEFIKNHRHELPNLSFILFGRDGKKGTFKDRIINFFERNIVDYIDDASFDTKQFYQWFESNVKLINYALEKDGLDISADDLQYLKNTKIDFFYHSAALTNMWHDEESRKKLEATNVGGTKNILELIKQINVVEFDYIGTAYACGKKYGVIKPDFINEEKVFRNNYERTKLEAELLVRDFEKETGQKCRYFRPSVIAGRMIEKEFGAIEKFDVFYGWALFFVMLKKKYVKDLKNIISEPVHINLRYRASKKTGLNIVPVDYCAKIIYHVCMQNHPDKHFHLAYKKEIPHQFYFSIILKTLNISGVEMVEEKIKPANKDEILYYKSCNEIYGPYMNSNEMLFDTSNIEQIEKKSEVSLLNLENENIFSKIFEYCNKAKYGLKLNF